MGSVVIMGRKTFESMGGVPLQGRVNVVVTRVLGGKVKPEGMGGMGGVFWAQCLESALSPEIVAGRKVYIIGGVELYKEALAHPACEECIVTHVLVDVPGCDTFFPMATAYSHGWGDLRMRVCAEAERQVDNGIPYFIARYRRGAPSVDR